MRQQQADDIIHQLSKDRTLFYYFKDRYAVMLLGDMLGGDKAGLGTTIVNIKSSSYNKLLQRPLIAKLVAQKGDGKLTFSDLERCWPIDPLCYRLTLGVWGEEKQRSFPGYYQTSRKGVNLVLQLNFSNEHDSRYARLIDPYDMQPFSYDEHPIARPGFYTLAWARLDVDFKTGEVLIEELQSDWIRYVKWSAARFCSGNKKYPPPR